MKTRINKYLVGALLCAITHNGYSMDGAEIHDADEVKPIPKLKNDKLINLATALQKKVNDSDDMAGGLAGVPMKENGKSTSMRAKLQSRLNSGDPKKVEEALKIAISLVTENWEKSLSKADNKKISIKELFDKLTINETPIKITGDEATAEEVKTILNAITGDNDLKEYAIKTDRTKKVKDVKQKGGELANEKEMLYDEESPIEAQYLSEELDLSTSTNIIQPEKLTKERLTKILETTPDKYNFFEKDEDESVRNYVIEAMTKQDSTIANINQLFKDLHATKLSSNTPAAKAIIQYIVAMQSFKPEAADEYAKINDALPSAENFDKAIKAFNKTHKINEDQWLKEYDATDEVIAEGKLLKALVPDISTAYDIKYKTDNKEEQIKTWHKLIPNEKLIKAIKDKDAKIKDANNEKISLEQAKQLKDQELANKVLEYDTLKKKYDATEKRKVQLEKFINDITKKINSTLANLGSDERVTNPNLGIGTIQDLMIDLLNKGGTGKGDTPQNIKDKEEEIRRLQAQIKDLNNANKLGAKKSDPKDKEKINELTNALAEKDNQIDELQKKLKEEKEATKGADQIDKKKVEAAIDEIMNLNKNNSNAKPIHEALQIKLRTLGINIIDAPQKKK